MHKSFRLLPLVTVLALSGCMSLAPDYERPEAPVAQVWPQDEASRNAELLVNGLAQWSDFFTDARLHQLISLGLENNRSLRSAVFNVERARALYNVSRSELLPSVAAVADETAKRTPESVSTTGRQVTSHTYSASLAMTSYELDLFGRVRSSNEMALQSYFQTQAAQRTAQMTVVTEIASTWLSLGAAKAQLKLAADTLTSQQESLKLIEHSYEYGASSQLDVQRAKQTVATAQNAHAAALRSVAQMRNALTMLVGAPVPENLEPNGIELNVTTKVSAVSNVPSEVLLNRPDIAAAEAVLKSANANIGVARANFFPRIALTGSIGTISPEFSNLFDGGTRFWNWAPSVSLPIFTGGANISNLRAAQAQQKAAVAEYEYAIQTAFREVADALAVEGTVADQLKASEDMAAATAESYRLAQERYQSGADSYLSVLDSQRSNFSAQQSLITAQLARATSYVTLYKVMGGGSQLNEEKGDK